MNEHIIKLIQQEVKRILTEEVTLEIDSPHWMNDNVLRVSLMLNDETITSIGIGKYDLPS